MVLMADINMPPLCLFLFFSLNKCFVTNDMENWDQNRIVFIISALFHNDFASVEKVHVPICALYSFKRATHPVFIHPTLWAWYTAPWWS